MPSLDTSGLTEEQVGYLILGLSGPVSIPSTGVWYPLVEGGFMVASGGLFSLTAGGLEAAQEAEAAEPVVLLAAAGGAGILAGGLYIIVGGATPAGYSVVAAVSYPRFGGSTWEFEETVVVEAYSEAGAKAAASAKVSAIYPGAPFELVSCRLVLGPYVITRPPMSVPVGTPPTAPTASVPRYVGQPQHGGEGP